MIRTQPLFAPAIATLVLVFCAATPSFAQPELKIVDNLDGSFTLQIEVDANGSIATELTTVDGGLFGTGSIQFTGAFIADPLAFDFELPGNNPITGTVTDGLFLDNLSTNEIFASFGSVVLSPGTFDFLTVTFEGAGIVDAFGIIAQQGTTTNVIASAFVVPEPATASLAVLPAIAVIARRRRAG